MKTVHLLLRTTLTTILVAIFSLPLWAEPVEHVLQKGETLYTLGKKYHVPVEQIISANDIQNPAKLKAGQKLVIPQGSYYDVKKGDTFYSIARANHITVDQLLTANKLGKASVLKVGDTLFVPSAIVGASSVASSASGVSDTPLPPDMAPLADPRNITTKKIDNSKIWPVKGTEISYLNGKLYGVLITAGKGAEVTTIAAGNVMTSSTIRGFGNVVFVHADNGYIYVYGGLDVVSAKPGDRVSFGSRLGMLGTASLSGKSQVYLMVYKNNKPVDPAKAPRG